MVNPQKTLQFPVLFFLAHNVNVLILSRHSHQRCFKQKSSNIPAVGNLSSTKLQTDNDIN